MSNEEFPEFDEIEETDFDESSVTIADGGKGVDPSSVKQELEEELDKPYKDVEDEKEAIRIMVERLDKEGEIDRNAFFDDGFDEENQDPFDLSRKMFAERQAAVRGFKIRRKGNQIVKSPIDKEEPSVDSIPDNGVEEDYFWWPQPQSNEIESMIDLGLNTYLHGPTGSGKSDMAYRLAKRNLEDGKEPRFVEMSGDLIGDDLFGTVSVENGNTQLELGPVTKAMQEGVPLIIEEIDAGAPSILMRLHNPLIGRPVNVTKQGSEMVHPSDGFMVIATANTIGRGDTTGNYGAGTGVMNEAFLDRFHGTFYIGYPPKDAERKILCKKTKIEDCDYLDEIMDFADAARESQENGDIRSPMSVRRTLGIAELVSHSFTLDRAVVVAVLNKVNEHDKEVLAEEYQRVTGREPAF